MRGTQTACGAAGGVAPAKSLEAVRHDFLHSILLFRGQGLTLSTPLPSAVPWALEQQTQFLLPGHPGVFIVSNQTVNGKPMSATNCALKKPADPNRSA